MLAHAVNKEVTAVQMTRVMVQIPKGIKIKLDGLRRNGTSISGYIRALLERELTPVRKPR